MIPLYENEVNEDYIKSQKLISVNKYQIIDIKFNDKDNCKIIINNIPKRILNK
jgi:hypothetical protein